MSERNTNTDFIFNFDDKGLKQVQIYTPRDRRKEAMELYEKLMSGIEETETDRQIRNQKGGAIF